MSGSCKRAASIIVFGKSVFSNTISNGNNVAEKSFSAFDYKLLVVKRSSKSSFMPNGIVFPGGIYHETDASRDWFKLYHDMNICSSLETYPIKLTSSVKKMRENNSLDFSGNGDFLPNNLAFRITAIRELFEECGLLLAKTSDHKEKESLSSGWASFLHSQEILGWQQKVQENPREFIHLCEKFKCVPDVWSLKDWSNWLTPVHLDSKRFDTTFFVAALNQIPPTLPDSKEISELKWSEPGQLLNEYKSRGIWLPPPQYYELSRISKNFNEVEKIVDYSNAWYGCPRWMPVGIKAADGWIYLMPGDEKYPVNPNFFNSEDVKIKSDKSDLQMADLREKCSKLHRLEIKDPYAVDIVINHYPSTDHVYPEQILKT